MEMGWAREATRLHKSLRLSCINVDEDEDAVARDPNARTAMLERLAIPPQRMPALPTREDLIMEEWREAEKRRVEEFARAQAQMAAHVMACPICARRLRTQQILTKSKACFTSTLTTSTRCPSDHGCKPPSHSDEPDCQAAIPVEGHPEAALTPASPTAVPHVRNCAPTCFSLCVVDNHNFAFVPLG
ncbi:hypothetical protein PAPYR_5837 [Paratrimastix pyriformis]|uniref:Uncharacterized protein n=1 Tax=Paratrimastix pyriformis TaxID=342808 RepID=A0ABQ8UNY8_9EUKA|nr:hypothetical protein PAPYR_5837 [Paratrimastix pyriformis]